VLPLVSAQGRFLVDLPQGAASLRLVPDSGAESVVLFDRGGALPAFSPAGGVAEMSTLAGGRRVTRGQLMTLAIGPTIFQRVPAVVVARNDPGHIDADGLLPLHLFNRVTMNGPARTLTVE
jgi:hypothetical protein